MAFLAPLGLGIAGASAGVVGGLASALSKRKKAPRDPNTVYSPSSLAGGSTREPSSSTSLVTGVPPQAQTKTLY